MINTSVRASGEHSSGCIEPFYSDVSPALRQPSSKGDHVQVQGQLRTREYQSDATGSKERVTEIRDHLDPKTRSNFETYGLAGGRRSRIPFLAGTPSPPMPGGLNASATRKFASQFRIINRVELIGYEPETTYTPNGKAVATLSVATKASWMKGDERQERTDWHRVQVIWN
jgi:single-stranded DNA-binding protein